MYKQIAFLKPCCIGDVIFATPLLQALHWAYPEAAIDWFVSSSAIGAIKHHPHLRNVIDTGPLANPASRLPDFFKLVNGLRHKKYDLIVVPDRSPLLGAAVMLSGIPTRAGLDSAGRGFAYTIKAPIDPQVIRHEADIYLDIARVMGFSTEQCWANVPPSHHAVDEVKALLHEVGIGSEPFLIVHPGGGVNAGMTMTQKRWPALHFAALADRIADRTNVRIVVIGVASDSTAVDSFVATLSHSAINLTNQLSLPTTAALASLSRLYIGNDNGIAHLAAAAGAKVLMIFGPSDPRRYGPYVPPTQARYVWRDVSLPSQGVSAGIPFEFDWDRDGATVDEAWCAVQPLLE